MIKIPSINLDYIIIENKKSFIFFLRTKKKLNLIILFYVTTSPSSFSKSIALKYFDLPTNETCNLLVQYFQWTTSVLRVSITYRMKCNTIFTGSIPIF